MYALAWLCLAVAVVSLLLGLSREGLMLIYVSIAASVGAMVFLLAGVLGRPTSRSAPAARSGSSAEDEAPEVKPS